MKYTHFEKLQTIMLCEIFKALEIKNNLDPELVQEAVTTDNYWALEHQYFIETGEKTPEKVEFVLNVLTLFETIQNSYSKLSEIEKNEVLEKTHPFSIEYFGFDFNHEHEYVIICSLLKKLKKYEYLGDIAKNSHMPSIAIYQRMLNKYLAVQNGDCFLSKDSLIEVIKSKKYKND